MKKNWQYLLYSQVFITLDSLLGIYIEIYSQLWNDAWPIAIHYIIILNTKSLETTYVSHWLLKLKYICTREYNTF